MKATFKLAILFWLGYENNRPQGWNSLQSFTQYRQRIFICRTTLVSFRSNSGKLLLLPTVLNRFIFPILIHVFPSAFCLAWYNCVIVNTCIRQVVLTLCSNFKALAQKYVESRWRNSTLFRLSSRLFLFLNYCATQ